MLMPLLTVTGIGVLVGLAGGVATDRIGHGVLLGLLTAWAGFALGALAGIVVDSMTGSGSWPAWLGHAGAFAAAIAPPAPGASSSRKPDARGDTHGPIRRLLVDEPQPRGRCLVRGVRHPQKEAMLQVREIILSDPRISEIIKWKSPTFMYEGNMASFNPRTKAHVSLMFHTGASIPGEFARLEGGGDTARYMRFADVADVAATEDELKAIVSAWCESR